MGEIDQFFNGLFGQIEDDRYWFLLWTLKDHRSNWFHATDLEAAAEFAVTASADSDVYCSVSVYGNSFGPKSRGDANDSAGIVGLWADIDIASDIHSKQSLPPDEESARQLIADMGHEPTIIIHSGHGYQAWWLFDEPWKFIGDEDRQQAATLARRWNDTLRSRAATRKWVVDSVYDLARVMRVPGTFNRKGEPVPTRIVDYSPTRRYSPSDLESYCIDDDAVRIMGYQRTYITGPLVLKPNAQPDVAALEAMLDNNAAFKKVWEGKRRDLESASEIDLSLASMAAKAEWTDQEIANLLIYGRAKRKEDQKLRQNYYGPTIAKAHTETDREMALENLDYAAGAIDEAMHNQDEGDQLEARRAAMVSLSQTLGVEIIRIIKFKGDPAIWRMVTPGGDITIGPADCVLSPKRMKDKIYEVAGVVLPTFTQTKWDKVATMIQKVVEEEEVSTESTDSGQMLSWISDYLSVHVPVEGDRDQAAATEHPYRDNDDVVIFSSVFRAWLKNHQGERIGNRDMGIKMHLINATYEQQKVTVGTRRSSRGAWRIYWPKDSD